jgi:hypothetical protein
MSSTRKVSARNLVSQEAIQFIRSKVITLTLIEARPTTKMNVFFGDDDVTYLCNLKDNAIGTDIVTDTIGQAVIELNVPSGRFNVGTYDIIIADTNSLANLSTTGSVFGSAKGTFSSTGKAEIFQTIETTITTVTRTQNIQRDPLAQSFFTYGIAGGMFLSSIEVYFQTKDPTVPVRCELRDLENGFPSPIDANNINLVSILKPEDITISLDASVPSKFVFEPPIYLQEESDFCFVLRSNSNNYNVFTSRMGENSIEDGRKIFDQPYIGSLFKSENNVTWTAEQFEDIKFKINKAVFSSSASTITLNATVPPLGAMGTQFSTVSGSDIVTYSHLRDHGLEVGSLFKVITNTTAPFAKYNGIPYIEFNDTHTILSVPDRKTLTFQVSTNATSTGVVSSADVLTHVTVIREGVNYTSGDSITFSGGGGTGATGTLNIVNGNIKQVNVTGGGTGYTTSPSFVVNTTTGTGAVLATTLLPTFTVYVNKPMTGFIPKISAYNFDNTSIANTITTTIGNYDGGNLVTYNPGKNIEFVQNYPYVNIGQNSVIASTLNENDSMSGVSSAKVTLSLSTANPNVSPVLDLNTIPYLDASSHVINNQPGELLTSVNSSGSLDSVIVTSAGSGYTVDPVVTISAPDLPNGVQATATATRSGNTIATIAVDEAGSGYTSTPLIVVTRGAGDTTGINGAAQAVLVNFNTELLPTSGSALGRYITKKNTLQIISNGVRMFCVLSSIPGSYVDWYIRTSLSGSGVDHEQQEWVRLNCAVERTKSSFIGDYFEYEFRLDDIAGYDTYDLKCVMGASDPTKAPIVSSYRVIVIA